METFTAPVKSIADNFWSMGTTSNPTIQKSLDHARELISLSCHEKIGVEDTRLIISQRIAAEISTTHEIHSYLQRYADECGVISNFGPIAVDNPWMIPDTLYGTRVVLDENLPERTAKMIVGGWVFTFTEVY